MKNALFAGPKAAQNYLEMARYHGFPWIDINGSSPDNFPETFDSARMRNLRAQLEDYGLGCGIHTASYVSKIAHAYLLAGGFVPFLKSFGDKLENVQISDNKGISDEHLPIGGETVDFGILIRELKKMDYRGMLSLSVAKDNVLECRACLGKNLVSAT